MEEEKKGLDKGGIAVWMILGGFVGMILSIVISALTGFSGDSVPYITYGCLAVSFIFIVIGAVMLMAEKSNDEEAHIEMEEEKKNLDLGDKAVNLLLGSIAIMILSIVISALSDFSGDYIPYIIYGSVALFMLSLIIGTVMIKVEKNNNKAVHIENINAFQEEYDKYVDMIGIVKSDIKITLLESGMHPFEAEISHYLWVADDCIKLFPRAEYYRAYETSSVNRPDVSELQLKSVPIDSILYFEEMGELRKYATVSGGGTSLKGALLGYAIAEDVGAIIGSREPITTKIVSEDDRRIELVYKNKEGEIENLEFKHDAYDVFKKLIPLKEFRKIVSLNTVQSTKSGAVTETQKSQTAKEKLKQLKELKAEGLITEEEYSEQKKKVLESL